MKLVAKIGIGLMVITEIAIRSSILGELMPEDAQKEGMYVRLVLIGALLAGITADEGKSKRS